MMASRVHLNGKFIFASPNGRWMDAGPEKISPLPLRQGWNALRIDVVQGGGDWAALRGGDGCQRTEASRGSHV